MEDKIKIEPPCPIKGHVKVQLFDAKTGKLKHEQEGENFITHIMKSMMKAGQIRQILMHRFRGGWKEDYLVSLSNTSWSNYNSSTSSSAGPFAHMYLTTDDSLEDPENQQRIVGSTVGWAETYQAVVPSGTKGTLNTGETNAICEINKTTVVIDFPTNVANGTFQSIWFRPTSPGLPYKITAHEAVPLGGASIIYFHGVGDYIYYTLSTATGGERTRIRKIHRTTKERSIVVEDAPNNIGGLAYDGVSKFYTAIGSSLIGVYDEISETWSTFNCGVPDTFTRLQVYGGYLYIMRSNGQMFRRINLDTMVGETWASFPTRNAFFVDENGFHFFGEQEYYLATEWEGAQTLINHSGANIMRGIIDNRAGRNHTFHNGVGVLYTFDTDKEVPNASSRKRLDLPVTKTSDDVMKITYTFEVVE